MRRVLTTGWTTRKSRRLFSFVIPLCHQNQEANQRTNTPYIWFYPGLFQSSRKTRSREPRVRKWFRGTHNRSPQLQQDMIGVMGIRPRFTIPKRYCRMSRRCEERNGTAGRTWGQEIWTQTSIIFALPLLRWDPEHATHTCHVSILMNQWR